MTSEDYSQAADLAYSCLTRENWAMTDFLVGVFLAAIVFIAGAQCYSCNPGLAQLMAAFMLCSLLV